MAKYNTSAILLRYYMFVALPASLAVLFYENFLSDSSREIWRSNFAMLTFSEHMHYASRTSDYYTPPRDTNEVIMCPTVQFIHHSEYLVDQETGMFTEVDDSRLNSANQPSNTVETPPLASQVKDIDGRKAPEATDAGAWEKINIGHLQVADPEEGDEDWSDEIDDWNEHVWSVAEFLPRSIPCWSPLEPENLTEEIETDFVMSSLNIRRILAEEVFEVTELNEEQEHKQ